MNVWIILTDVFSKYRGALSGKGGKWTTKTLDKYLKSPADYAPGKLKRICFYKESQKTK